MSGDRDDDEERLEDTRNEIRKLQASQSKHKQDLQATEEKRKEVQKEIVLRERDLSDVSSELASLRRRAVKDTGGQEEEAKNNYISREVLRLLEERIPRLGASQEGSEAGNAAHAEDVERRADEPGTKVLVHDTVLVSYVRIEKIQEDYKVAYRIGKDTSVDQLHRDACSYWGCSHNDYGLCKVNDQEDIVPLWEPDGDAAARAMKKQQLLQSEEVLKPSEQAHLHLVRWKDLEVFQATRRKLSREQEQLAAAKEKIGEGGANTLKTVRHGFGFAVSEKITEPFVEALKPWPGLYDLLQRRNKQLEQKWVRIKLVDIACFGFLLLLCLLCFQLQDLDAYQLRYGAMQTLGRGLEGETSGPAVRSFESIRLYDDIWNWLDGSFHYQLFAGNSTLRQMYTPVGFLRLRQQKASRTACPDREVPPNLRQLCHFVTVGATTQDRRDLILPNSTVFANTTLNRGRLGAPSPFTWQAAQNYSAGLYGALQESYDGAGYTVVYGLSPEAGATLRGDMEFLRSSWISASTRMLAVELTLANYHLGGYVAASFLLEISPSGAVHPAAEVLAFHLGQRSGDGRGEVLDVFRWIVVVGYLAVLRVNREVSERIARGKRRWEYFLSLEGAVDMAIVGMFVAIQVLHRREVPLFPTQLRAFYSYSSYARTAEIASICESLLLLLLLLRLASFARMQPQVFRFFKMFARSLTMFASFCIIFLPVMFGTSILAHSIWSPYVLNFSTYVQSFMTTLRAAQDSFSDVLLMYDTCGWWTVPFLLYFFLSTTAILVNMFLAITVHSYFEVELVEGSNPKNDQWSAGQWLDWALWAPVYAKVTGKKAGASRIAGYVDDEEESDSSSSSDSDDEK